MTIADKSDYVGVIDGADAVYVIVGDRAKFEMIQRPVTDHGKQANGNHVLTKTVAGDLAFAEHGVVIFQHWITTDELPVEKGDAA